MSKALQRSGAEMRVEKRDDGKEVITGYAAVFYREDDPGTQYELWRDTYERILPGAFNEAVGRDDVRSLFNHDPNIVLGRAKAGTLRLSIDGRGLRYEIDPPDTQLVRDQVLGPIKRGEVTGSSFMFVPTEAAWANTKDKASGRDIKVREIRSVRLMEVGPVVFPAYEGATAGMRSDDLAEAKASYEAWEATQANPEAIAVRLRMLELDLT
jgi:HK97 family phage prohead protease